MSRNVSAIFKAAAFAAETGQVPVLLLTFDHEDLTEPIRISTDNADTFVYEAETVRGTISRGNNYVYCPVTLALPDDSDESISKATMEIDNVDRRILQTIRGISSPPTITMELVLAASPNTVEASFANFSLVDVTADVMTVQGTFSLGSFLSEPYPGGSMLPSNFPGLF